MAGSVLNVEYVDGPPFPPSSWQQLKVLDISGTGYYPATVYETVMKRIGGCSVTHFYAERCVRLPCVNIDDPIKIEVVSLAGHLDDMQRAFADIKSWASLPSLKEMNASGCGLTQVQRDEIVTARQNVVFNLSTRFEASKRVDF